MPVLTKMQLRVFFPEAIRISQKTDWKERSQNYQIWTSSHIYADPG